MSKDLEYKTNRAKYWKEVLGLAIALITLITLLVQTCFKDPLPNDPLQVDLPDKKDTIFIMNKPSTNSQSGSKKNQDQGTGPNVHVPPVLQRAHPVYDTIQLIMNARLSNLPIEVDGSTAKTLERYGTVAKILIQQKDENHTITIKNGDRLCEKSFYGTGNRVLTINLEDCK